MKKMGLMGILGVLSLGGLGIANVVGATGLECEKLEAIGKCAETASDAVEREMNSYFFENGERVRCIRSVDCERRVSRKGIPFEACEVAASADGGGDVTFGVMQVADCGYAFKVFVIQEE